MKNGLVTLWNAVRNPLGYAMMVAAAVMAFIAVTGVSKADDITDTITSVGGYQTAAVAIGISVLLFVIGRKVVRKLIALALLVGLFAASSAHAADPTDITGVVSAVGGYQTAAVAIGISVLLFVIGRKVVRKLI